MQYTEEKNTSKAKTAKSKSQTSFLKKYPSYVVAFSFKETYDDLVTAQQMICNKSSIDERSPQESNNSITPTKSLKMFETEQIDKLNPNLDMPETIENLKDSSPHDSINSMGSMTPTNSLNYLTGDNISDASLITIGEKENMVIDLSGSVFEYSVIENEVRQVPDNISKYLTKVENDDFSQGKEKYEPVDENADENTCNIFYYDEKHIINASETEKISEGENKNEGANKNTESMKELKNSRKYKKRKTPKRQLKKTVNIKKNFKYKNPKKVMNTQLEKYYEKRNSIDANQIQKELYSNKVSTVISRSVLHKIIARENLPEQTKFISFLSDVGLNEYDNESLSSFMSTTKKSLTSNSSQDTIKQKPSTTSIKNEQEVNEETVDSIVKVHTENTPYKTDVINVAVAVAYNRSKVNTQEETAPVPSNEKFMHLGSLTSSEAVPPFASKLTSESPTEFEDFKAVTIETSDGTLVNKNSSFGVSSDDFVIARTSSDFSKSSENSTNTLKNNTDTIVDIEPVDINNMVVPVQENKPTLLETVINLGVYPEMTPSTSSDTPFEFDYSEIIVSRNLNSKYPINSSKGDNKKQKITKNVLKKSTHQQKEKVLNRIINLPNQLEIKALLKENEKPQMKCAEESRHPSYMPEMWDRLVMTLDLAVKRLEDNLVEKIVKEMKNTFSQAYPIPKDIPTPETNDDLPISKLEVARKGANQGLQCDLVKTKIIDQIVQKLSSSSPKIFEPGVAIKSRQKPEQFEDFEVLKSPEVLLEAEKGDTVTVSTVTYEVCRFRRLKTLLAGPYTFLRENVFVITSVPTFFVVLLCFYGLILLLMKTL